MKEVTGTVAAFLARFGAGKVDVLPRPLTGKVGTRTVRVLAVTSSPVTGDNLLLIETTLNQRHWIDGDKVSGVVLPC